MYGCTPPFLHDDLARTLVNENDGEPLVPESGLSTNTLVLKNMFFYKMVGSWWLIFFLVVVGPDHCQPVWAEPSLAGLRKSVRLCCMQ